MVSVGPRLLVSTLATAILLAPAGTAGQPSGEVVGRQLRLSALRAEALKLQDAGSLAEALALYTQVADGAHELPRFPGAGPGTWQRIYNQNVVDLEAAGREGMGSSLVALGQFERALPHYERALALYPTGENPMWEALIHNRTGFAFHRMLEREKALREYRQALVSASGAAGLLTGRLRSRSPVGNDPMQAANDAVTLRQVYLNASTVLVSLGRFEEAIEAYHQKELVELQEALRDPGLLQALGDIGPLIDETNRLVDAFLVGGEGACLNDLAEETGLPEHYEKAIVLLKKAVDMARALPGSEELLVGALSNLGSAYQGLGRGPEAAAAYLQAIDVSRRARSRDQRSELAAWNNLADLSLDSGDLAQARAAIDSVAAISQAQPDPEVAWRLDSLRGRLLEAEGRLEEAAVRLQQAILRVEQERAAISIPKLKETFFRTRQSPYESLARVLAKLGRHEDALYAMETMRSRSLADSLSGLAVAGGVSPALEARATEAVAEQRALLLARNRAEAPGADPGASERLAAQQERARNAGRTYLEILAGAPEYADVRGADPLRAKEIAALLDSETVVVSYLLGQRTAMAAVLGPSGTAKSVLLPTGARELQRQASEFAALVRTGTPDRGVAMVDAGRGGEWRPASEALYRVLVDPVREQIAGARRLAIVPYGALNYVPFAALARPGGGLLVESHEIVVLPSATVLKYCRAKSGKGRDSTVVFSLGSARPQGEGGGWSALPWTLAEGDGIRSVVPGARLVQEWQFTKESVIRLAPSYDVVHFATHGLLDGSDPLLSAVITADEPVRVEDIFEMRLRAGLVVLSACDSGLGRIFRGDEIVGLTRAFFYAGAPSVLATLWSVNDESTARFMTAFYRALHAPGTSKPQAVRQAQLELMKRYPSPFHWAPFALWGDWR